MVKNWLREGIVWHGRLKPFKHSFRYKVFYMKFPLSQLGQLSSTLFSINQFNLFSFYYSDYLDGKSHNLDQSIREYARAAGLKAEGEICLQTFPRILGYVFNPVSFWEFYKKDGTLEGILAEVNNTFGDRHFYLINGSTAICLKEFHVSPFFDRKGFYQFQFAPQKTSIDYYENADSCLFKSSVTELKSHEFSTVRLLKLFFSYPLMNLMVMVRIHWQALKLFLKKATFYKRPQPLSPTLTKVRI